MKLGEIFAVVLVVGTIAGVGIWYVWSERDDDSGVTPPGGGTSNQFVNLTLFREAKAAETVTEGETVTIKNLTYDVSGKETDGGWYIRFSEIPSPRSQPYNRCFVHPVGYNNATLFNQTLAGLTEGEIYSVTGVCDFVTDNGSYIVWIVNGTIVN